ncbi:MAG: T9SS type A sorting domain-containing protein [Candidatus Coatesbacteria bacterium]|nr:MAG: T9SS type A sorting domain-containing protein [Candidatus Coatesbacteria bacterium]
MGNLRRYCAGVLVFGVFLIPNTPNSAHIWELTEVEGPELPFLNTEIVLDASGDPHIVYFEGDELSSWIAYTGYVYCEEGEWNVGYKSDNYFYCVTPTWHPLSNSIGLDSQGYPHLAYPVRLDVPEDYNCIEYAYFNGNEWETEYVDVDATFCCSIRVDDFDVPRVIYYADGLAYGFREAGVWEIDYADEYYAHIYYCSLGLDSVGLPHAVYKSSLYFSLDLKYAYFDGTDWTTMSVDNDDTALPDLTLDSDNRPHVVYLKPGYPNMTYLMYAYWDGVAWEYDIVDEVGLGGHIYSPSIDVDSNGNPHIAYSIGEYNPQLKYAVLRDDDWAIETVEMYYHSLRSSLALDANDNPHISYIYAIPPDIVYMKYAYGVANNPPAAFNLTLPPDGEGIIEPVTLDWEDSTDGDGHDITYDVWYATDPSFDPHDEVNELTDSTYTFPEGVLSDDTTYYWKVRAWDGYDETWSGPDEYWSFTVDNELGIPVIGFTAESNADGIALTWECAAAAVGFNLYRSEEATGVRNRLEEMLNAELIIGETPYSYIDAEVSGGLTYNYWLEAIDIGGSSETFGPASCTAGAFVPTAYALYQSRPNPARGSAVIAFDLPEGADVTLTIYDLSGRKVKTLVDETLPAGAYEQQVSEFAPGVYVYKLSAGSFAAAKKMVVQ